MNTKIMRDASYLLPPPGGEVVRDLLDSYDTLLASHATLVEAVKWERECRGFTYKHMTLAGHKEFFLTSQAARAEVDRLIATADCEGDG